MTPEGRVKERIKQVLRTVGAYWHMPVQNGMGAPTVDFVGCHRGRFFAIEAKAPGKRPTPRQQDTLHRMEAAGGKTFVVDGDMCLLVNWLKEGGDAQIE